MLERVRATGMLAGPVLVLLSGGRDSTCLLDVAVRLGAAVRALHVDHGLRPGAAADAEHCRALCDRLGVALEVARLEGPPQGNVQAWARAGRYAAARAAARGATLATGHTASDQVETVLLRLAASPGRRALLGMPERAEGLVRPLLAADVTREETTAWCAGHGLAFREDPSNGDPAFARTRAREGLVPALRAVDPRAEANVLRTARALREEAAVLDALVDDVLDGAGAVARDRLAALPPALGRLVLRRLAEDATGRPCARAAGRLDDVLALAPGGALDLGEGARARRTGTQIGVGPTPGLG